MITVCIVKKTKVGDRYVLENMLENGYSIGGEQSVMLFSLITLQPETVRFQAPKMVLKMTNTDF